MFGWWGWRIADQERRRGQELFAGNGEHVLSSAIKHIQVGVICPAPEMSPKQAIACGIDGPALSSGCLVPHRHASDIYVKLGDFGLSRESRGPTTLYGTPRYAAPEIHTKMDRRNVRRKEGSYTPAVDIWSFLLCPRLSTTSRPSWRRLWRRWVNRGARRCIQMANDCIVWIHGAV